MKSSLLSRYAKKMLRQGQPGQTIVIMAFGFIILLGFVGIVTDASLLFVRYNSLRRAVDAAAVAAAGQMRRTQPNDAELAQGLADCGTADQLRCASNYAFARNIANINLAARQFIEFYGLNPINVLVETCATALPTDPNYAQLECTADKEPRKLVRVTAQITSETVFMRLLGWGSIVLEANAISESAVLDVVMIFDGSESMLNQTSYEDWEAIGQGMRYLPPRMFMGPNLWGATFADTVESRVEATTGQNPTALWQEMLTLTWNQMSGDARFPVTPFYWNGTTWATGGTPPTGFSEPRPQCRVRFYPAARAFTQISPGAESPASDDVQLEYQQFLLTQSVDISGLPNSDGNPYPNRFEGFVPTYNYFGCCNDPDGNGDFSDLICQPFKQVRNATEAFLDRIDFARGDRVSFVVFDRAAYLIDPDAGGPQTHMITSQASAVEALRKIVGVRAEPNFYADVWNNGTESGSPDGLWDHLVYGGAPYDPASLGNGAKLVEIDNYSNGYDPVARTVVSTGGFDNTPVGELTDYPVKDNCYFGNAIIPFPYSRFSAPSQAVNGSRFPTSLAAIGPGASWTTQGSATIMHPNLNDPAWDNSMSLDIPNSSDPNVDPVGYSGWNRQVNKPFYSYEVWAYCGGSNVGAALRVGNNALQDPATVRANGSVWVMVMLGDGAAAQSDPVQRNRVLPNPPNPYNDPAAAPVAGEYGAYGVCPYGSDANNRAEIAGGNTPTNGVDQWENKPPRCMDEVPHTRHFCEQSAVTDGIKLYVDISTATDCQNKYDVDDFARDWADYIGLAEVPETSPFKLLDDAQGNRDALALPTIFTIGFGLDFQSGAGTCQDKDNLSDCLGEELLRYIADVGDNQRIDSDYQQDLLADGFQDGILSPGQTFGERGACEGPVVIGGNQYTNMDDPAARAALAGNASALVAPLPPEQSCGNYYNAPSAAELGKVFDDIASRMFTRITR